MKGDKKIKNKNIVVTGGLGFIGSHISEELCKKNDVTIVDNESTGNIKNVQDFQDELSIKIGDVNKLDLNDIFEDVDYVLHQAALPSVPRSIKDPISSNETNITGTLKVLNAAHETGVKKVVFASSSSVYGDTPKLPKVETMPINPKSPYAITKATGELYCNIFEEIYGLPTVSLRYFNVFGPRQDPNSQYSAVIPKFITAIKNGVSPMVYGDGTQSRDFTYVKNVVNANIKACESNNTGIFNIACGRQIILNDLIKILNEIMGKNITPLYVDPRPGDINHSLADIKTAKSIGYNPKDDFINELKLTIEFFWNDTNPKNTTK
ncbi:UDP-glucose 4-epimerase [Methanobacterium lacus]|uniref:UDP-glucose 4-epimerase n=1 Tax=Methanobacterium lacus (strain AL-21) TaxID=877455 RepID=F0TBN8_METLA|nr:SDR family oxidoreductase [Methanobacterium lacus]ADZ09115.1 UDP-glucose 4-epimerase [Methanobacterium lacus]